MSIDFLGFLARLLPHYDKIDDLLDAASGYATAAPLVEKWEVTKRTGDILVPILADVTGLSFESEEQAINHVTSLKLGDGKLIGRLRDFYNSPLGQLVIGEILKRLMGA